MALDTFVVLAASYEDEASAIADYDAVRSLYTDWGIGDTYDAAVVTRDADGKVSIVRRHEQPVVQGSIAGLGVGLAIGALTALFPAVGLGAGLAVGAGGGAALGALGGHVVGGLRRHDLKELGEHLDRGHSGLLVVVAEDVEARIDAAMTFGAELVKAELRADERDLEALLDEAVASARG